MPNRRRERKIGHIPLMEGFKPFGVPARKLEKVILLYEEYEALRLTDYENLTHEEASKKMDISRPTFTRLYDKARKTIAKAFVEGSAILIQGGHFVTNENWYRCPKCKKVIKDEDKRINCEKCDYDNLEEIKAL
jgi:predicted DNA-binding protein (UPF0251 family)